MILHHFFILIPGIFPSFCLLIYSTFFLNFPSPLLLCTIIFSLQHIIPYIAQPPLFFITSHRKELRQYNQRKKKLQTKLNQQQQKKTISQPFHVANFFTEKGTRPSRGLRLCVSIAHGLAHNTCT